MNFFFLEIGLILDQVNGLFNVFVSFRSVAVFEATEGDAIVRVVTLCVHGQGKLVTAHFYFKVLNPSMMTNRAGSMDMARCLYAF
jgi:hypothetical protein